MEYRTYTLFTSILCTFSPPAQTFLLARLPFSHSLTHSLPLSRYSTNVHTDACVLIYSLVAERYYEICSLFTSSVLFRHPWSSPTTRYQHYLAEWQTLSFKTNVTIVDSVVRPSLMTRSSRIVSHSLLSCSEQLFTTVTCRLPSVSLFLFRISCSLLSTPFIRSLSRVTTLAERGVHICVRNRK